MRAQLILSAHIASDDSKLPSGRQGREGRDFLTPLEQTFYCNFHIHERRPRAYARVEKNNGDLFSRPSRPTRPGDAVADLRSAHSEGWAHPTMVLSSPRRRRPVSTAHLATQITPDSTIAGPYASALTALRAACPNFVEPNRWR
jgi:hypothetical protein